MSFNYAKTAATADRLIKRFGKTATLRRTLADPSTYNPATGVVAQPVETQTTCSAVVIPYGDKLIDGTLIRQGDKQAFVAVVNVSEPKAGDFLLWEGVSYTVMNSKTLAPAGVNVIYELQVRTP